ncbi:hypothetical protein TTHERM_000804779 (macronuclear) [Tetrahymena thermophila SB210]|uniref:Uncharacterized protein n=1 Tax=Tetrahymena thermophila (strain SB210) TaxID=312017 RepID=W7XF09_TETTS|nr:hypothetical protein TTHERM_000804779 [Tetrahymena thermophila SB210]EWS75358.1 hypothetical protein TTHERM_000804779 [Tetrahymena thermophila SB210]|eukprot:XP_012652118.1 hypothetical protein TTHERM_000804779 [Tetrahymena thermophila SB210]
MKIGTVYQGNQTLTISAIHEIVIKNFQEIIIKIFQEMVYQLNLEKAIKLNQEITNQANLEYAIKVTKFKINDELIQAKQRKLISDKQQQVIYNKCRKSYVIKIRIKRNKIINCNILIKLFLQNHFKVCILQIYFNICLSFQLI